MTISSITGIRLVGAATAVYGILQHRRIANINIPRRNYTTYIEKGWPNPTYPEIDLTHIGGYDNIKELFAEYVLYLENPKKYIQTTGLKPPKGVILSGSPGLGKSFFAKALAGHARVPFILVSGAEFGSPYIGETEKKIGIAFEKAREIAPCVLGFDEIESIGGERASSEISKMQPVLAHHRNGAVNRLLTYLAEPNDGVVIIGTTNDYEALDKAVVRPGRFDKHIFVPLPTRKDRKSILEIHAKDKKLASDISIDQLAAISSGYSGAKIAGWVNEAAIFANRENSQQINALHFDKARTLIEVGVFGEKNEDPLEIKRIATREAAKALVGHLLNLNLYKVSVLPYGGKDGMIKWIQPEIRNRKQELLDDICMLLAGRAGEIISQEPYKGRKEDIKRAKDIAIEMVKDEGMGSTILGYSSDVEVILEFQMKRAQSILLDNQSLWEQITQALIEHDELLRSDFLKVIDGEIVPETTKRSAPQPLSLPPIIDRKVVNLVEKKQPEKIKNNRPQNDLEELVKEVDKLTKLFEEIEGNTTPKAPKKVELKEKENPPPFTIDELAKALNVDVTKISAIEPQYRGGVMIVFKPSFQQSAHIEKLVSKFEKMDIHVHHYAFCKKLEIQHYGIEEFIKFVKEHN